MAIHDKIIRAAVEALSPEVVRVADEALRAMFGYTDGWRCYDNSTVAAVVLRQVEPLIRADQRERDARLLEVTMQPTDDEARRILRIIRGEL